MKYEVLVTRDATESAVIEVEAESPEKAADAALDKAGFYPVKWEINDNAGGHAYLGSGLGDVEESEK